jgi:hypothetical protein
MRGAHNLPSGRKFLSATHPSADSYLQKALGMYAYVWTRDGGRSFRSHSNALRNSGPASGTAWGFSGGKAFVETVAQRDAAKVPGAPLDANRRCHTYRTARCPAAERMRSCPLCPPLAKGNGRTNLTEGVNAPL